MKTDGAPRSRRAVPDPNAGAVAAFTLLELLLSGTIMALVLVLLLRITGSMQESFHRLNSAVNQRQDGRTILAALSGELRETLTVPASGFQGAAPGGRQFRFLINPPTLSPALTHSDTLFWSSNTRSASGGAVLLGYAVRWDTSVADQPRPYLCRMVIPFPASGEILGDLQSDPADSAGLWPDDDLFNTYAPGDAAHGYRGWLSDQVLALYIRALDPLHEPITRAAGELTLRTGYFQSRVTVTPETAGEEAQRAYDSLKGYRYRNPPATGAWVNRYGPALPPAIEIAVVVATPRSLMHLKEIPARVAGSPDAMWSDIAEYLGNLPAPVRKEARVYSTVVPLPAEP